MAAVSAVLVLPLSFAQVEEAVQAAPGAPAGSEIQRGPKRLKDYGLKGLDEKVVFNSTTALDVSQLIEVLAHIGGINNIVIAKDVAGITPKIKLEGVTVAAALEVVDCGFEGLSAHDGAVHFLFGQASEVIGDVFICHFCGFFESHTLYHLC